MSTFSANESLDPDKEWIALVRQKVASMRFGSVQILVHEGRVTQVESTEKTRIPDTSTQPPPSTTRRKR